MLNMYQHNMFAHVANDHDDRCILCRIGRPTFFRDQQTYEGPQGPGTMALNSGIIGNLGPLRPMMLLMYHVLPLYSKDTSKIEIFKASLEYRNHCRDESKGFL